MMRSEGVNVEKRFNRAVGENGWWLKREGANHDIYTNGKDMEPIPRHREINETLAKAIIRRRGLK